MQWVLNLDKGYVRCGESTDVEKLEYRKVGELLLALAESKSNGASRQQLGEQLWPSGAHAARATNLRQALRHLRRIIGEELITTSAFCRLASATEVFLDNGDGSCSRAEPEASTGLKPVHAFGALVEVLSLSDPDRFLQLITTCPDMEQCLPHTLMSRALEQAAPGVSPNHPNLPWLTYWRSNVTIGPLGIRRAYPLLKRSTTLAYKYTDPLLVRETTYDLAASEILLGRPEVALRQIDEAEAFIRNSSAARSHRMQDLRGSALMHMGRNEEALEFLDHASEDTAGGAFDFAWHYALRALYTANTGDFELAARLNEAPARFGRESGAAQILGVSGLTSVILEAATDPRRAIHTATELVGFSRKHKIDNIALYAQETLADAYVAVQYFGEAKSTFESTKAMRQGLGYSYTHWDRRRLRRIALLAA
jgi:tetratricopeptide (TPR) repeat protein